MSAFPPKAFPRFSHCFINSEPGERFHYSAFTAALPSSSTASSSAASSDAVASMALSLKPPSSTEIRLQTFRSEMFPPENYLSNPFSQQS
ncbi:MAG: hypothetical protein WCD65_08760, partial [Pseudolabrys sp.]